MASWRRHRAWRYHGVILTVGGVMAEYSARVTLRLPERLHRRLVELSAVSRRSLNSEIVWRLETALELPPDRPVAARARVVNEDPTSGQDWSFKPKSDEGLTVYDAERG